MDELLIKYVLDEATAEERRRVEAWITESPDHRRRLEQFQKVWTLGRVPPSKGSPAIALARFRQKLSAPPQAARLRPFSFGKVAAVIAGLLVVGAGTWIVLRQKKAQPMVTAMPAHGSAETATVIRTVPAGDQPKQTAGIPPDLPSQKKEGLGQLTSDTLSDGTVVLLQRQARIEWLPAGRNPLRRVKLSGDAAFTVAADPAHPFVVEAALLRIKVLGTSFSIHSGKDCTKITLHTGSVLAANATDSVILHAGETLTAYPAVAILKVKANRAELDAKEVMRMVINESIREKLVPSLDSLGWLALDSGRFIIDDRVLPDPIKARYQSKYLLPDGMGFYYGKVKVHGHGYFFEKKELY